MTNDIKVKNFKLEINDNKASHIPHHMSTVIVLPSPAIYEGGGGFHNYIFSDGNQRMNRNLQSFTRADVFFRHHVYSHAASDVRIERKLRPVDVTTTSNRCFPGNINKIKVKKVHPQKITFCALSFNRNWIYFSGGGGFQRWDEKRLLWRRVKTMN